MPHIFFNSLDTQCRQVKEDGLEEGKLRMRDHVQGQDGGVEVLIAVVEDHDLVLAHQNEVNGRKSQNGTCHLQKKDSDFQASDQCLLAQ